MENRHAGIVWHHSASTMEGHQAEMINESHKARNFTLSELGFYGGYHILVEKDGTIVRYRNDNEIGCHTLGHNEDTLGICMAGNFDVETPTPQQITAAAKQMFEWQKTYFIPTSEIRPHRYFSKTDCPGKQLADELMTNQVNELAQAEYDAAQK